MVIRSAHREFSRYFFMSGRSYLKPWFDGYNALKLPVKKKPFKNVFRHVWNLTESQLSDREVFVKKFLCCKKAVQSEDGRPSYIMSQWKAWFLF